MKSLTSKVFLIFALCIYFVTISKAQSNKLYNENENPFEQFERAKILAREQNKHVLLQIGGNWCKWCIQFHHFYTNEMELDSIIKANYIVANIAYDPKKDQEFFASLGFPQRFGFPVFVVTDSSGIRLHTQNSWYLEDGGTSYDKEKTKAFFRDWSKDALNPDNYKKKD
jgi:hypothetical protein